MRQLQLTLLAATALTLAGCGGNDTFSHRVEGAGSSPDFALRLLNVPIGGLAGRNVSGSVNGPSNPLPAGGGMGIQVEVTSVDGFAGNATVTLGANPPGFAASVVSPNPIPVPLGGKECGVYTVSSESSVGETQLVTVTGGGKTHSATAYYAGYSIPATSTKAGP